MLFASKVHSVNQHVASKNVHACGVPIPESAVVVQDVPGEKQPAVQDVPKEKQPKADASGDAANAAAVVAKRADDPSESSSAPSDTDDSSDESEPETPGARHHRHKSAPEHPMEGRILLSGEKISLEK